MAATVGDGIYCNLEQDEKLIPEILIDYRALMQLEKYALHFPFVGIFGGKGFSTDKKGM